jgi:hypothetical protein
VTQFYKDDGFFPQWSLANAGGPGLPANEVDLLVSPGNIPTVAAANTWTTGTTSMIADQLMTNVPAYGMKAATAQFGWNGPYLTSAIGTDAWNNRYAINVALLDASQGTQTSGGVTKSAVWVISAGPNGVLETPYSQPLTTAQSAGDDIGVKLQ